MQASCKDFCIVSSDSDFTRLAARLRESEMLVVGMGEKKRVYPEFCVNVLRECKQQKLV